MFPLFMIIQLCPSFGFTKFWKLLVYFEAIAAIFLKWSKAIQGH